MSRRDSTRPGTKASGLRTWRPVHLLLTWLAALSLATAFWSAWMSLVALGPDSPLAVVPFAVAAALVLLASGLTLAWVNAREQ